MNSNLNSLLWLVLFPGWWRSTSIPSFRPWVAPSVTQTQAHTSYRYREAQKAPSAVFIRVSSYSKVPWTRWPTNNRNVFLTVWKLEGSGTSMVEFWQEPASWFRDSGLFTVSSHGGRGTEVSGVSFIRALIPFGRVPPHLLIPSY